MGELSLQLSHTRLLHVHKFSILTGQMTFHSSASVLPGPEGCYFYVDAQGMIISSISFVESTALPM